MAHLTLVDLTSRSKPMATTKFTPSGGVTAASRRASEKRGHTMPGGGFPIENSADLARAKHDVGRASNPAATRRWINKRAQDLGEPKLGESGKARGGQVDESDVARSRYVASRGGQGLAQGGEVSDGSMMPTRINQMRDPYKRVDEARDRAAIERGRLKADVDMADEAEARIGKARGGEVDRTIRHGMMGLKALFTKRASHEDREPKRKSRWG